MKKLFLIAFVFLTLTSFSQYKEARNEKIHNAYLADSVKVDAAQLPTLDTSKKIAVIGSDGKVSKSYWPTPTLQQVTNAGNTTTTDITAATLIWKAGTGSIIGTTSSVVSGSTYGALSLKNTTNAFAGNIYAPISASRNYSLPDASGTIALTANIPTAISGTYTPAVSGGSNLASSSTNANVMYTQVGSVVTVSGQIQVTPTAAGQVSWNIDLPVATANFSATTQAGGTAAYVNGTSLATAKIVSNNGAQTVSFVYRAPDTAVADFSFTFQYTIQ